ncbi:heme NO-binding domain-containing protein [Palleronia sp. KMU-117]|uniref:heme NO-binding domain-containing protein n=1 Tax=Palleronia sp. KMU-117 TaxID=3434108 RepID=UPI003D75A26B
MYGLVNRALQRFLCDTYGAGAWHDIARATGLRLDDFEPLLTYPEELTMKILAAASERLRQSTDDLLEDLGTYLVSHPTYEASRRLLRFGGGSFVDFVHSLDDLPDRARLALPDLVFPRLAVEARSARGFLLTVGPGMQGFSHVLTGVLRGMADDYGALALIEHTAGTDGQATILVEVHDTRFAKGRRFELAVRVAS